MIEVLGTIPIGAYTIYLNATLTLDVIYPMLLHRDTAVNTGDSNDDGWNESDEDAERQDNMSSTRHPHAPGRVYSAISKTNSLRKASILHAFGEVNQKLDDLEGFAAEIRVYCDGAEVRLMLTETTSQSLLEHTESLQQESPQVKMRKSIVTLFLDRFSLTDHEIEALTSRDVPVGARFFLAMDKTARLHAYSFISGEGGPTKAGMDIMSTTSSYLEHGYSKIHRWRWVQRTTSNTMLESILRLSQRPRLLSEALTVLSRSKQNALLNLFLNALTRGGTSSFPRSIELHARDPIRYIGDMLPWVHQAIAAECEFFESLFGISGRMNWMVGEVRVAGIEEEWVRNLLDTGARKLRVPLKARLMVISKCVVEQF
ncbi:oligomeric complex COG6-domain-containing protein [Pisolithus marmoratus]|nr:oligomeric complex COG6-domain-containing protein [Pisolithus marmoratus]